MGDRPRNLLRLEHQMNRTDRFESQQHAHLTAIGRDLSRGVDLIQGLEVRHAMTTTAHIA